MKGIILAGGKGTRLYPITKVISKQLLPLYDKPMIYYPLSTLLLAGIREILIISTPDAISLYKQLFGDGSNLGIVLNYEIQKEPKGLAEAFIIGEEFIGDDSVCLILGDNVFYGQALSSVLEEASKLKSGAKIFGYHVENPENFGILELDDTENVISIEEKPKSPKSNYAVPGLYFYDNDVVRIAKNIKPSERGELEITAINCKYLKNNKLDVKLLEKEITWFDTGTVENMLNAAKYIKEVQESKGEYISCLEEIAYKKGFIDKKQLEELGKELGMTEYGKYIISIAKGGQ